jgi:hypothetical protein
MWFTDSGINGEDAVASAIARLEKGGRGFVTFREVYGETPEDPPGIIITNQSLI